MQSKMTPDVKRFAFITRLVSGQDDQFLERHRVTRMDRIRFRWMRLGIYRKSLHLLRRDYRAIREAALAGMQQDAVAFDDVLTAHFRFQLNSLRLESAGALYLVGGFGGSRRLVTAAVSAMQFATGAQTA